MTLPRLSLSLSHSISLFLTLCQIFSHVSFLMPKSCWMGDGTTAQVRLWSTACYCSCFCLNLSLTFSVCHRTLSIFLFMLYLIGLVILWHAKTSYIGHEVLYMSSCTWLSSAVHDCWSVHGVSFLPLNSSQCCQCTCNCCKLTFTFMHLSDAFIQSDLQCIQAIHFYFFISMCVFTGNWTHGLLRC